MKVGELEEYMIRNIKEDALTAIDALESIVHECDGRYVSRRYLNEKAEKAKWCVNYIAEVVMV